jgi:small subunit ribosomal protein S16
VAADSRAPRDGRFIEILGWYNPRTDPASVSVKEERVLHWLQRGATPTQTVKQLLERAGVWAKWRPPEETK